MDKTELVVSESFCSQTEEERRRNVQEAVDLYLRLRLCGERTAPREEDAP